MPVCAGCLGDRQCWVCTGTGRLEIRGGLPVRCHRCGGTSDCPVCGQTRPTLGFARRPPVALPRRKGA